MTQYLRVFCTSEAPITAAQVGDFIIEGAHFDAEPRFEPLLDSPEALDPRWESLSVTYENARRPVVIEHTTAEDELLAEELSEIKEELESIASPEHRQRIAEHLDATRQTFAIDHDPSTLSDDAWEMLDTIEGRLAQGLDGLIYAPDDGFFDAKLQRICDIR